MVARIKEKENVRHRVHQRYYVNGVQVPGVTTILNVLNKPALVPWAHNLGLQGIDYRKFRDEKADVGTLAHYLVQCDLTGEKSDQAYLDTFPRRVIDLAENSLLSYLEWRKQHEVNLYMSEAQISSSVWMYGGTIDIYCQLDGVNTLIDIKTGKAIYDNYFIQVAGYRQLLQETGHSVERSAILNVPRAEDEKFAIRFEDNEAMDNAFQMFCAAKVVYSKLKELGWRL